MDGTIRIRTAAAFATSMVVAVLCTLLATQAWSVDAAPGDADSTFVPTAGCRVADTRAAFAVGPRKAPLAADETLTVDIHGANGDCTGPLAIPTDAVAVALNVTATNATTNSNIRIFPADLAEVPNLSNLNVTAGASPTPNKVDVKLSPDGKIKVYNFRGSVNIFIDIVGYYTNATLQELSQRVAALETAAGALDAAQPFVVTDTETSDLGSVVTVNPVAYVSVELTAPVDGHVTVHSTAQVRGFRSDAQLTCAIFELADIPTPNIPRTTPSHQMWRALDPNNHGTISGTRVFDIAANETVAYSLACEYSNEGPIMMTRSLAATFTPAP